jgi:hypothetical protein
MIRIAITEAGFEAVAATLPLGTVSFERHPAADGRRLVWFEPHVLAKLRALRGPGESYAFDLPSACPSRAGWRRRSSSAAVIQPASACRAHAIHFSVRR